jgi:hypothetical protein
MSSDTPLTDEAAFSTGNAFILLHSDAQKIERILMSRVSQLEAQLAEARKDSERLAKADRLALYDGKDGHREWWSGGTWLYPGDEIIQLDAKP